MLHTSDQEPLINLNSLLSDKTLFKGLSPYSLSSAARYELEMLNNTNSATTTESTDIFQHPSLNNDSKRILFDTFQILKKLKNGGAFVFREAVSAINDLRQLSIEKFTSNRFGESLVLSHQALALSRQYHIHVGNTMLSSEMSTDLYIISVCFAKAGRLDEGLPYLKELRYLVESSIKGQGNISVENLFQLTFLLGKLYIDYGDTESSNFFLFKHLDLLKSNTDKIDKAELCDSLQRVCSEMMNSRQYDHALELANEVLEIRISLFGDYKSDSILVADAYCNLGLLYRLNGNPIDALHKVICGLDMLMRIYRDRSHVKVQNALLSIACCYHVIGETASAYNLYTEVLFNRLNTFGPEHPCTVSVRKLIEKTKVYDAPPNTTDQLATTPRSLASDKFKHLLNKPQLDIKFNPPFKIGECPYPYARPTQTFKFEPRYFHILYPQAPSKRPPSVRILPVVNLPHLSFGDVSYFASGEPMMAITPESVELFSSWNIEGVEVTSNGDTTAPKLSGAYIDLKVIIPFVRDRNIFLSFHDKPLYLPNPALAHVDGFVSRSLNGDYNDPEPDKTTSKPEEPEIVHKASIDEAEIPTTLSPEVETTPKASEEKTPEDTGEIPDKPSETTSKTTVESHDTPSPKISIEPETKLVESPVKESNDTPPETKEPSPKKSEEPPSEPTTKLTDPPKVETISLEEKLGNFASKIGSLAANLKSSRVPSATFKPALVKRTPVHLAQPLTTNTDIPEVLTLKSLEDKIPLDIARKVVAISEIPPKLNIDGSYLLDNNLEPIVIVPWEIDITMLKLATRAVKRNEKSQEKPKPSSEQEREQYAKLLAGDGLRELGFFKEIAPYKPRHLDFEILNIPESAIKKFNKPPPPKSEVTKQAPKKTMPAPKSKGKFGLKPPPKAMPVSSSKTSGGGVVKDTGKNRRFNWDPAIGDDPAGTMFEEYDLEYDSKELEQIQEVFAKAAPKEKPAAPKQELIRLLESKRAYNMNIALAKFRNYTFQELRQAVMDLDTEILNTEAGESFLKIVPNSDELSTMKEYVDSGGDLSRVDIPEQFVASLIGIPLLQERLEAHYTALTYREKYNEIMNPLGFISAACEAVTNSRRFKAFAYNIYRIGNMINEGQPRKGQVFGFKLSTLDKLMDFRTTSKPIRTILRYVIEELVKTDEDAINVHQDLAACEKAASVDISTLQDNLTKLGGSFNKIQKTVAKAKEINDPLADKMKDFIEQVAPRISYLNDSFKETMEDFNGLCKYLCYQDNELAKLTPEEVFGMLSRFSKNVQKTYTALLNETKRRPGRDVY